MTALQSPKLERLVAPTGENHCCHRDGGGRLLYQQVAAPTRRLTLSHLHLQVLFEGQKASNGVYLALVGVWYRVHASATVPELDFISRTSRKVNIEVRLEG